MGHCAVELFPYNKIQYVVYSYGRSCYWKYVDWNPHIYIAHPVKKKSTNTFWKSKMPEASVADPIGTQEDVGLLFPCSLIFGYHHYLPVRSKVPSIHGVFRAEPPRCLNIMAVIWRWRDNWVFHPQALEITSTGGRWMMARKKQRPGDYSLTSCNFSIIHIII